MAAADLTRADMSKQTSPADGASQLIALVLRVTNRNDFVQKIYRIFPFFTAMYKRRTLVSLLDAAERTYHHFKPQHLRNMERG